MADGANAGEDFSRETFELAKDLDRMTEQMENISVNLTWMAYDMLVLRTDPQLSKSIKRLENEFVQCKAVICGSGGKLMEKMEVSTDIVLTSTNVDLDDILMQLDTISETLDQLEVKTQLLQFNLTVCVTHPDKMACLLSGVEDPAGLKSPELVE